MFEEAEAEAEENLNLDVESREAAPGPAWAEPKKTEFCSVFVLEAVAGKSDGVKDWLV